MKNSDKTNLVEGIFSEKTNVFNKTEHGLVNYEIANAIIESMDDIDINRLTKEEISSVTEKVLVGLSQNVNWFDQVKDIVIDSEEYQKVLSEQENSDEEFAEEEEFHLDEYFEEDYDDDEIMEEVVDDLA